jgi:hypothetical protein
MAVQTSAARPGGRSLGAATVGLVVTLVGLVVVLVSFLLAPLALLGVALVAYLLLRPRSGRTSTSGRGAAPAVPRHGFGAGTR